MQNVRKHVAAKNPRVRHAEGPRRRHVVERRDLHRFGAQKARERRPAGHPDDDRKQEEPHVGALESRRPPFRVAVHEDRDEQDRGRDEKDARNRGKRRVEILNRVVDASLEVASRHAERGGEGKRRKRGERPDHDRGAKGFQRFIEDVVADGVGSEGVAQRPERERDAREHRERREGDPGCETLARTRDETTQSVAAAALFRRGEKPRRTEGGEESEGAAR